MADEKTFELDDETLRKIEEDVAAQFADKEHILDTETLRKIEEDVATQFSATPTPQAPTLFQEGLPNKVSTSKPEEQPSPQHAEEHGHGDPEGLIETQADSIPVIPQKEGRSPKNNTHSKAHKQRRSQPKVRTVVDDQPDKDDDTPQSRPRATKHIAIICTAVAATAAIIALVLLSPKNASSTDPRNGSKSVTSTNNDNKEEEQAKQVEMTVSPQRFQELTLRLINSNKINAAKENIRKRKKNFFEEPEINYKFLEKQIENAGNL